MTYTEKLKSKEWKLKRKEILKRDDFACQICGHKSKINEIHHTIYHHDTEPWDYCNDNLVTLCRDCHQQEEDFKDFDLTSLRYLYSLGILRSELNGIIQRLSQCNDRFDNRELIKDFVRHINNFKHF